MDEEESRCEARGHAWRARHKEARCKLGIPFDYNPWSEQGRQYGGVPRNSGRMRELVELAWAARRPSKRFLPWFADLSQCATRAVWGPQISTLATSARIFDFRQRRLLRSREVLVLQGYSPDTFRRSSGQDERAEADLLHAAGQGMFLPSLAKAMVMLFLMDTAPWWHDP